MSIDIFDFHNKKLFALVFWSKIYSYFSLEGGQANINQCSSII